MRVNSLWRLLLAALVPLVAGAPAALAQYDDDDDGPPAPRGGYYERAPRYRQPAPRRAYVPPPQPEPQPWYFPFGRSPSYQPQPQYQPQQPYPRTQPQRAARPKPARPRRAIADQAPAEPRRSVRPRPTRAAPVAARQPVVPKPKPEPTTTIAVFGDSLADSVADGLDDAFEDAAGVVVVNRTRGDGGLVRADVTNWPKQIADYLATAPKSAYVVVMLGLNDRQSLRDGDASHEPLSERWRALYTERIDAVVKPLSERGTPFVWVGTPPVRNERYSADLAALNDLYRERVQRAGGIYVDIWPGFVDDKNHYAATGPDVDGQIGRLRAGDGIHFTRAGARKAAHFAEVELRRLIEGRGGGQPGVAATPTPSASPAQDEGIDRKIMAALPPLPEPEGLPPIAVQRPAAGPVLPLTRNDVSTGGALVGERPRLEGEAGYTLDRALRDGVAPQPRPGRADDFRWPPRS